MVLPGHRWVCRTRTLRAQDHPEDVLEPAIRPFSGSTNSPPRPSSGGTGPYGVGKFFVSSVLRVFLTVKCTADPQAMIGLLKGKKESQSEP